MTNRMAGLNRIVLAFRANGLAKPEAIILKRADACALIEEMDLPYAAGEPAPGGMRWVPDNDIEKLDLFGVSIRWLGGPVLIRNAKVTK